MGRLRLRKKSCYHFCISCSCRFSFQDLTLLAGSGRDPSHSSTTVLLKANQYIKLEYKGIGFLIPLSHSLIMFHVFKLYYYAVNIVRALMTFSDKRLI